jgi:hypothetical protein
MFQKYSSALKGRRAPSDSSFWIAWAETVVRGRLEMKVRRFVCSEKNETMPLILILVAILAGLVVTPAAQSPSGGRQSAATITGAFADSCRDFSVHSSKDISYVELHYVAGPVVKDENINSPDHAIDGGAGDEIEVATVKSGTTIEEFACAPGNRAPTALLEILTPPVDQTLEHCYETWFGGLSCEQSSPRTAWTNSGQVPDTGGTDSGIFHWVRGDPFPCSPCSYVITFRGIGSRDPDADLASWSLDFGDGTSVDGTWSVPPTALVHDYGLGCFCVVTLTVTDSAGQNHSDTIRMVFLDLTPD